MNHYVTDINDDQLYVNLRRIIDSHSLILFAGSGLSSQAITVEGNRPPQWEGLLRGMVEWCIDKNIICQNESKDFYEAIGKGFFLEAAQELHDKIHEPPSLSKCLSDVLLCEKVMRSEAHQLIVNIPFRTFLTTNYDNLIENYYFTENRKALSIFHRLTVDGVMDQYRENKPFIFKLHGTINEPSTLIFGNRSYENILYFDKSYQSVLEAIFLTSSVLFIGFGYSDPDLESITSKVAVFDGRSKRHWILVPKGKFPMLKLKRLWADKGINAINYDSDVQHSGVVQFLNRLSRPPLLNLTTVETVIKSIDSLIKIETF